MILPLVGLVVGVWWRGWGCFLGRGGGGSGLVGAVLAWRVRPRGWWGRWWRAGLLGLGEWGGWAGEGGGGVVRGVGGGGGGVVGVQDWRERGDCAGPGGRAEEWELWWGVYQRFGAVAADPGSYSYAEVQGLVEEFLGLPAPS